MSEKVAYTEDDDLPKLFKDGRDEQLAPPLRSEWGGWEMRKSRRKTLNGLHTTIQGICELRNQCGFASHGSGSPRPDDGVGASAPWPPRRRTPSSGSFTACIGRTGHSRCRRGRRTRTTTAFNDSVDEAHGITSIFEVRVPAE